MNIKNKRSIFYLFVAMLISSVVIGGFCRTEFKPVAETQAVPVAFWEVKIANTGSKPYRYWIPGS